MKRQQMTIGAILEIRINSDYFVYAQIIPTRVCAFFDFRTAEPLKDLNILLSKPILYILAVYNDVITRGEWLKVGKLPVREDLMTRPYTYIWDMIGKRYELYNPNTGKITPSTKEECRGLEVTAVWDRHHVEDRIRDYYNGVPCKWIGDGEKLGDDLERWVKGGIYRLREKPEREEIFTPSDKK